MKQNKQPFHLYATDWQIEVNRMSTPKCQEEQIERFIMSLADGRVISALATIVASTTNNTLNNIINSGLKIDRTINGIHNKQKDYSIQPTTQHNQQYDVESSETPMDSEGDTVMGTNRIHQKHSHHVQQNQQIASSSLPHCSITINNQSALAIYNEDTQYISELATTSGVI
ncbi:hypothetical protein BC941DRAFT_507191 [Chlamydoabsidia padenii]|nr:hypothetical protein BC941DRAFT_507191 [Chlamydoabsidia padenii]